jgi:hypothetical protein
MIGMKNENYGKQRLQKVKKPFLKLMNWIGKAQKEKVVCKS